MYLKALTLRGFKSFATATTLKFEPGITCIVGPNGSGKSNVVDALTWVMGEQGAKSLRGSAMVDVIFAGTAARQPLGRAQVELTIDNSDGRLPIDFSEVTMSRTLFRGGASEYSINQSPARLLDVQELLSDTGMGRQMHVIVGQGQLDAVLNATAQERRAFIDEAAGVLKHRRRKERALRKLETMDQNLVRVLDLTEEMRRQLKPLARQAKAAQKASGVQARIVYAQRRLAAWELTEVMAALQQAQAETLGLRGKVTRFDSQIEQLRSELAELGRELDEQRQSSEVLSENWHGFRETVQRFVSLSDLAKERLRRASTVAVPISEASIELARERQAECMKEAEAAEAAQRAANEVFQEAETQTKQAVEEAQVEAGKLRLAEQELNRLLNQQTQFEAELARARSQVQSTQESVERARQRLQEAQARAADAAQANGGAQALVEQNLDTQVAEQVKEHAQAVENENQLRQMVESLTAELRMASEQVATWRARSQVLSESLAEPAETAENARNAKNAKSAKNAKGAKNQQVEELAPSWNMLGRLSEHILVAQGWEDAFSALLEPYSEAELIESLEVGARIEQMSQTTNRPVRALVVENPKRDGTLAKLAELPEKEAVSSSSALSSAPGMAALESAQVESVPARVFGGQQLENLDITRTGLVENRVAPARKFVAASSLVAPVLKVLLENAFLAESAEAAVEWLQQQTELSVKVATKAGTVLTMHSIRTRGEVGASRLRLRAELEEAKKQAMTASENLREQEKQLAAAREDLQIAAASAAEKLRLLRELDAKKSEQAKEMARISALAAAAEQEAERARTQLEEAEEALQVAKQVEADLEQAALNREKVVPETFLVEARESSRRADEVANEWRDKLAEARMQLHAANERLTSARRQMQAFNTQIEQLLSDRERQISKFEAANTMRSTATKVLEKSEEAMNLAKSLAEKVGQERQVANQRVTEISQQVGVVQGRIADLENRRAQLVNERQQAEVEFAQLQYKFEQAKEKALEVAPERDLPVEEDDSAETMELPTQLPAQLLDLLQDFGPEHFWPVTGNPDTVEEVGEAASNLDTGDLDESSGGDEKSHGEYSENTKKQANQEPQWIPFTREVAVEALAVAERELARLGVVNPLAIEEHDALKARHDFLLEQVEDLNRSKADLMKIIREVDQKVRESFQQAFEDVSKHFAHVFSVLFPGGSGRLELTDPDDPLHTGVEIHARPAGKKVTRMSLLSGGERSLASLAYLFAIFKARPSPFYVLDEIEAALDDINLSRVLEVLQELQKDSQLLIVTHQKRTMQIADALYGITMKDGVTTAISHRMKDRS